MNICIPVIADEGVSSKVNGHFGSAPYFAIYNTDDKSIQMVVNDNAHHSHGMCNPLSAIADKAINVVVCAGMGARAVERLNAGGIKAYLADGDTIADIINYYNSGSLCEITVNNACQRHGCH